MVRKIQLMTMAALAPVEDIAEGERDQEDCLAQDINWLISRFRFTRTFFVELCAELRPHLRATRPCNTCAYTGADPWTSRPRGHGQPIGTEPDGTEPSRGRRAGRNSNVSISNSHIPCRWAGQHESPVCSERQATFSHVPECKHIPEVLQCNSRGRTTWLAPLGVWGRAFWQAARSPRLRCKATTCPREKTQNGLQSDQLKAEGGRPGKPGGAVWRCCGPKTPVKQGAQGPGEAVTSAPLITKCWSITLMITLWAQIYWSPFI